MDVEEITTRLVRRFGPSVTAWCAAVPALAGRMAARWGLVLGDPFPAGNSSVAVRCRRSDGRPAVLKLSPQPGFLADQAGMLRLFAEGGSVPAVLAVDADENALLLEAVEPGTEVNDLPIPPTPEQWSDLLRSLHLATVPADPPARLRDRYTEFFVRIGKRLADPVIAAHIDQAMWNRAMERCDALMRTESARVLLHGDLHLGNVLDGGPRGLVAIDPKVSLGDPCFDAVDYVLDGAGRTGAGSIDDRCERLARAYGMDGDRLYSWCRAVAPVVAVARVPVIEMRPAVMRPAVTELLALAS